MRVPVALTVSGGVSLGSYEAGVNWATLALLKMHRDAGVPLDGTVYHPELVAITGASAGNVNAFLGAMTWCQNGNADSFDTAIDNAFYRTWISVGKEDLFPEDNDCRAYKDAYLSRHASACKDERFTPSQQQQCMAALDKHVHCGKCDEYREQWRQAHQRECPLRAGKPDDECLKQLEAGFQCRDNAYREEERAGLLTRNGFGVAQAWLETALSRPDAFDPACRLTTGVTLSRVSPTTIELKNAPAGGAHVEAISDQTLKIHTLRTAALLDVSTSTNGQGLQFANSRFLDAPPAGAQLLGEAVRLRTTDGHVGIEDVLAVVEASSAFPVAFSPREVCRTGKGAAGEETTTCSGLFLDGGVFDNIPLSLAHFVMFSKASDASDRLFNEPDPDHPGQTRPAAYRPGLPVASIPDAARFLYIDPDRVRGSAGPPPSPTTSKWGLDLDLKFLLDGAVPVAREAELQSLARFAWETVPSTRDQYQDWWRRKLNLSLSSRALPISGYYLGFFGAFLAREFRNYDYRVGIYDAIHDFAQESCRMKQELTEDCIKAAMAVEVTTLRSAPVRGSSATAAVPGKLDPETLVVLRQAFREEYPACASEEGARSDGCSGFLRATALPDGVQPDRATQVLSRHSTWFAPDAKGKGEHLRSFDEFMAGLREALPSREARGEVFHTEAEQAAIANPNSWFWESLTSLGSRLQDVETTDNDANGRHVAELASFLAITNRTQHRLGFILDPSSVPGGRLTAGRVIAHLIPHTLTGEAIHGGLEFGYRAALALHQTTWIVGGLNPIWWQRDFGFNGRLFATATAGLALRLDNITPAPWSFIFANVDAQYRQVFRWSPDHREDPWTLRFSPGFEVGVNLVAGKFRLAYAWCADCSPKRLDEQLVFFGINDLNGMLYWVGRLF